MSTIPRLIIAAIIFIAVPAEVYSSQSTKLYTQYVGYAGQPELIYEGHGCYSIVQSCTYGWLKSDGSFETDAVEDCSFYKLYDYEDEWDFAEWRAEKYVNEDEGGSYTGFKIGDSYWFDHVDYVCIEIVPIETAPPVKKANPGKPYYDAALNYYNFYASYGYYNYAFAYYYYYYYLGDYYYYLDSGNFQAAYRSYYRGLSYYYYFVYAELVTYEYSYYYYSSYTYYSETADSYEEDWDW